MTGFTESPFTKQIDKRFKNIETREEDNFTQIMHLKERVRRLDRWFNVFIVVNLVIAALYLIA